MNQLLTRLRNGSVWLSDCQDRLRMKEWGDQDETAAFLDAIDLWDNLDMALRNIYPEFTGCVLGAGQECAGDAPVRCRWCSGVIA